MAEFCMVKVRRLIWDVAGLLVGLGAIGALIRLVLWLQGVKL